MNKETKAEVLIFGGLAVFLLFLWYANKQGGAGTGLPSNPMLALGGSPLTIGGSTGPSFNIGGGSSPSSGSNCGCPSCGTTGGSVAIGSEQQLLDYLAQTGVLSALIPGLQPGGTY